MQPQPPPPVGPVGLAASQPAAQWKASTMTRSLWAVLFLAGIITVAVVAKGGKDPNTGREVAAMDAIMKPVPLLAATIAMIAAYVITRALSADLEGADGWIRRTRPAPVTQIAVGEVMRVIRFRGKVGKQSGKVLASLAFTLETADKRSIHVGEAAVHRQPHVLMTLYEQGLDVAVGKAVAALQAGQPIVFGTDCIVYADRIEYGRQCAYLAQIARVRIEIGTSVSIILVDAAKRPLGTLPDDEMLLRLLARAGKALDYVRVG